MAMFIDVAPAIIPFPAWRSKHDKESEPHAQVVYLEMSGAVMGLTMHINMENSTRYLRPTESPMRPYL
jgi:hypothetical protein